MFFRDRLTETSLITFSVAPEEALRALPDCARRLGLRAAVVTMGPRGAIYFDAENGEAGPCPAVPAGVPARGGAVRLMANAMKRRMRGDVEREL